MKPALKILYFFTLVLIQGAAYLLAIQNDELYHSHLTGYCILIISGVLGCLMGSVAARIYFERVNP